MREMISPEEASSIIAEHTAPLPIEELDLTGALGRTLAEEIASGLNLPPFANSAMDGYAVMAADTVGAGTDNPVALTVLETVAAGESARSTVVPGACIKIMTGVPVPPGADAIVMREDTRERGQTVAILSPARIGQWIRAAGSDVRQGEIVMQAGTLIRAAEWGMLAALDRSTIRVSRRPRVAIVSTGDELVPLGQPLRKGQIRDSNSWTLDGLARAAGAEIALRRPIGDNIQALENLLREAAANCDVIVTSGGVSAGDFDPVRDLLPQLGTVHFWRIAMKPGKPIMFATMKSADGRTVPIFGLPGNPVSVMVAFEMFVRPALLRMQGRRALRRVGIQAQVDRGFNSPDGRTEYVRVQVSPSEQGWSASTTGDQGSGRLSTMTASNALLLVPSDVRRVEAGQILTALMTDWPEIE